MHNIFLCFKFDKPMRKIAIEVYWYYFLTQVAYTYFSLFKLETYRQIWIFIENIKSQFQPISKPVFHQSCKTSISSIKKSSISSIKIIRQNCIAKNVQTVFWKTNLIEKVAIWIHFSRLIGNTSNTSKKEASDWLLPQLDQGLLSCKILEDSCKLGLSCMGEIILQENCKILKEKLFCCC